MPWTPLVRSFICFLLRRMADFTFLFILSLAVLMCVVMFVQTYYMLYKTGDKPFFEYIELGPAPEMSLVLELTLLPPGFTLVFALHLFLVYMATGNGFL